MDNGTLPSGWLSSPAILTPFKQRPPPRNQSANIRPSLGIRSIVTIPHACKRKAGASGAEAAKAPSTLLLDKEPHW
ncbi:hypothetical protein CXU09_10155 [Akkermansia muciniphila]|uniref:Uncharacterized protein n=1 Tax=Akkermansia muciniphila TaxID=239935 RepID=A0AAP8T8D3_9BACT|nr:hypothetical protein CXU09_10155 [Akkermansia muciniphila]